MDLGYDPHVENAWMRLQRPAWVVMLVLVLAGLAGTFGRGPLAKASATTPDHVLAVSYERFARFRTPTQTAVSIAAPRLRPLRLRVSQALLDAIPIQSIVPRPVEERALAGATEFVFAPLEGAGTATITFAQQPSKVGLVHGEFTLEGEAPVALGQLVWP
jgi:hypothetical protein